MKKRVTAYVLIIALMMLCGIPSMAEDLVSQETMFSDVPLGHYAYDAVMYLKDKGIINGKSESKFCPDDSLTREEFAKIAVQTLSLKIVEDGDILQDVLAGAWYVPYVRTAVKNKVMIGTSDDKFGVGQRLTRQDLAVVVRRLADKLKFPLEATNTKLYADASQISEYAKEAVELLCGAQIMDAKSDGLFMPAAYATRGETAVAIYNLLVKEREYSLSLGRYSSSPSRWDGPYDTPTDDKIAENMPVPFDASKMPTTPLMFEDFNDDDYGELKLYNQAAGFTFPKNEGVDGSGCAKLVCDDATYNDRMVYEFSAPSVQPGDSIVISAKMKAENVKDSGTSQANYRVLCEVYKDGKWVVQTGTHSSGWLTKDTDWQEFQFTCTIPQILNMVGEANYIFRVSLQMRYLTGTFYYDDVQVSTLLFEPIDTVLMKPSYKGLIYGENGVGDIALRTYTKDYNGAYDLTKMSFKSQIVDENDKVYFKSECDEITPVIDVYFSSKDLPMGGDYYLEIFLIDKETGETQFKRSWTIRKREESYRPKTYLDEGGYLVKNGERYLPLALIFVNKYTFNDEVENKIMNHPGLDVRSQKGVGYWYSFGIEKSRRDAFEYFEECGKGITLSTHMFRMNTGYNETEKHINKQEDIRGYLSRVINNFKDLPILDMWYMGDEVNPVRMGEEMRWANEIVASNDLDHPTYTAICELVEDRPGIHAKTADILVTDPYYVTGEPDQDLHDITHYATYLRDTNPGRPFGVMLQGFWYKTRGDLRGPTQREFRNMMWQSLIEGAVCINCFAYEPSGANAAINPGYTLESWWDEMLEVYSEVQRFKPIILSDETRPYVKVINGGTWLNYTTRRYDGKSYLFTVNNQDMTKVAKIHLDGVKKITGMYSGKTYTADKDGWFKIELSNQESEVFEYEQSDYKSTHAELIRFGLLSDVGGLVMLDADGEKPRFIVAQGVSEVEIGAQISENASIYINDVKVNNGDKISLAGLSEINVKVVSEDGRFKSEKGFGLEFR